MRRTHASRFCCYLAAMTMVLSGLSTTALAQDSTEPEQLVFGRGYKDLDPEQQTLLDDWVKRFNDVMERTLTPEELYESIPLSFRTTYEAATHALLTTRLTDDNGADLGRPIDLVDKLDSIQGKIKGAESDRQFRLYVQLKPTAVETLKKSREFSRGMDNTVYHKGYPINYRQQGGVPSVQFSVSRDLRMADIDVDYRSSKFPGALLNGHLSSSNSDVRAGNNYDRHVNRWTGLGDWWRNLFGLPIYESTETPDEEDDVGVARQPQRRLAKIEDAVADFLTVWLIERRPTLAMGYVSEKCNACVELEAGRALDSGMIRYRITRAMMRVNDSQGQPKALADATQGVRLTNPALKVVQQPNHAQFVVFEVPDDVAASFDCTNRLRPEDAGKTPSRRYGRFYGAVFRITIPGGRSETLATLWTKENEYWRMVSYESEPETRPDATPDLRASAAATTTPRQFSEAPADFMKANHDFLEKWFVKRDYHGALSYLSERSEACYELYRQEDSPKAAGSDQIRKALADGLKRTAEATGNDIRRLEDAIQAFEPANPLVRLVKHPHDGAYVVGSVPNRLAESVDCAARARGEEFQDYADDEVTYGTYFGSGMRVAGRGDEAGVLYLFWAGENGSWKIVSYDVATP